MTYDFKNCLGRIEGKLGRKTTAGEKTKLKKNFKQHLTDFVHDEYKRLCLTSKAKQYEKKRESLVDKLFSFFKK